MMRLGLLILTAAASFGRTTASVEYDDLVLTSIDVQDIGNGRVRFRGRAVGDVADVTSVFLKNVKTVEYEGPFWNRTPVFEAEKVPLSEVVKQVQDAHTDENTGKKDGQPLLSVHGFNVQPEGHLEQCLKHKGKFTKFKLIPVIWPSGGGIMNYWGDRGGSEGAGRAFRSSLAQYGGAFPQKSLLAHSMGNRVLRFAADEKFEFDNIFMAAADVNGKMFYKKYIEADKQNDPDEGRREDGLTFNKMLAPGGKIFSIYNRNDYALAASWVTKLGVSRLGAISFDKNELHEELKETVESKDAGSWLNWGPRYSSHGYHFDDEAIEFYESKFHNNDPGQCEQTDGVC